MRNYRLAIFSFHMLLSPIALSQEYSGRLVEWVPATHTMLSAGIGKNNATVVFFSQNQLLQRFGYSKVIVKFLILRQDYIAYIAKDVIKKQNGLWNYSGFGKVTLPHGMTILSIPLTLIPEEQFYNYPPLENNSFAKLNCLAYKALTPDEQIEFKRQVSFLLTPLEIRLPPHPEKIEPRTMLMELTSLECLNMKDISYN